MAVTANQVVKRQDGCRLSYPVAAGTHIYEGTLCFINASGYLDDDTGSGVNKFAGVAIREVDNSSGSNGDLDCEVWADGVFELVGTGFTQADVGKNAHASDNYTVAVADSATTVRCGVVAGFVSSTKLMISIEGAVASAFQSAALTTQSTTITHTAPGTPDFAVQDLTSTTPFGFVTQDEGNTVLSVIKNLQTRVAEIEAILQANGLVD